MSNDGPTLPDMLALVPHLLAACVPPRDYGNHAVRALRLVSKVFSGIVMQDIRRCSVQLGADASLTAHQVVQMMQSARLRILKVTVITTSGRSGPVLAQQLAACTSQLCELLEGMKTAIKSVTRLTVCVKHKLVTSGRSSTLAGTSSTAPQASESSPASFAVISRTVCTMLAAAMPGLEVLTLEGGCRDAALPAFGASCPGLVGLHVQAISVHIKALQDAGQHCPKLEWLMLISPQQGLIPTATQLADYVGSALHSLRAGMFLKTVELKLNQEFEYQSILSSWRGFPPNLESFSSSYPAHGIENASNLLATLRYLCLEQNTHLNVFGLLGNAPLLERLYVPESSATWRLWCDSDVILTDVSLLKQRMLEGLQLDIHKLKLIGLSINVQDVLTALPPLPEVRVCVLEVFDNLAVQFLADISRTFPRLTTLIVLSHSRPPHSSFSGDVIMAPLATCASLEILTVDLVLSLTTAGLAALCQKLPCLKELSYLRATTQDDMQWLSSLVDEFPQASPQQRSGNLSGEQLLAFFSQGSKIFNDLEFKQRLAVEHRQKRDIQETINEMQRQVFESQGVQGAFGIQFLSKVKKVHGQNAVLLTAFYEFVQREEMALDEAELPGSEFQMKYEKMAQLKLALEAEAANLPSMTQEQRQIHMAGVMQRLIASTAEPSCANPSSGGHQHGSACCYIPPTEVPVSTALSTDEQLNFYQSLAHSGHTDSSKTDR